jgi:hypothetical protein
VEVAGVKLAMPPRERREPGEVVAIPRKPETPPGARVRVVLVEVAYVRGEEVAK